MITDAVLSFFFGAVEFFVTLFPEAEIAEHQIISAGGSGGVLGNSYIAAALPIFQVANYVFPLSEAFRLLLWVLPLWLVIILVRELRAWLPF